MFIESHARAPREIILDIDATDDPVHGTQEGRQRVLRLLLLSAALRVLRSRLLVAKLRSADMDAAAGAVEEVARVVARIRARWPKTRIVLRADSGFARDDLMTWCEANGVDFLLGLARNERLAAEIAPELALAAAKSRCTGRPERRFRSFTWRTRGSWSRPRCVVVKRRSGPMAKRTRASWSPRSRARGRGISTIYCARGEMENRIKECQLDPCADRTSAATMRANQRWGYFLGGSLLAVLI
jgi:hypothetical protein